MGNIGDIEGGKSAFQPQLSRQHPNTGVNYGYGRRGPSMPYQPQRNLLPEEPHGRSVDSGGTGARNIRLSYDRIPVPTDRQSLETIANNINGLIEGGGLVILNDEMTRIATSKPELEIIPYNPADPGEYDRRFKEIETDQINVGEEQNIDLLSNLVSSQESTVQAYPIAAYKAVINFKSVLISGETTAVSAREFQGGRVRLLLQRTMALQPTIRALLASDQSKIIHLDSHQRDILERYRLKVDDAKVATFTDEVNGLKKLLGTAFVVANPDRSEEPPEGFRVDTIIEAIKRRTERVSQSPDIEELLGRLGNYRKLLAQMSGAAVAGNQDISHNAAVQINPDLLPELTGYVMSMIDYSLRNNVSFASFLPEYSPYGAKEMLASGKLSPRYLIERELVRITNENGEILEDVHLRNIHFSSMLGINDVAVHKNILALERKGILKRSHTGIHELEIADIVKFQMLRNFTQTITDLQSGQVYEQDPEASLANFFSNPEMIVQLLTKPDLEDMPNYTGRILGSIALRQISREDVGELYKEIPPDILQKSLAALEKQGVITDTGYGLDITRKVFESDLYRDVMLQGIRENQPVEPIKQTLTEARHEYVLELIVLGLYRGEIIKEFEPTLREKGYGPTELSIIRTKFYKRYPWLEEQISEIRELRENADRLGLGSLQVPKAPGVRELRRQFQQEQEERREQIVLTFIQHGVLPGQINFLTNIGKKRINERIEKFTEEHGKPGRRTLSLSEQDDLKNRLQDPNFGPEQLDEYLGKK